MANNMNMREEAKLLSQTVANPKGQYGAKKSGGNGKHHEQVQAVITVKSGRELKPRPVASNHPNNPIKERCLFVDVVDEIVEEALPSILIEDPSEACLAHFGFANSDIDGLIEEILERLAAQSYYCFLDGCSSYNQVPMCSDDQAKTAFTCPFGTFAYHRMPFRLCNALATFQRCMMAIFFDMVEKFLEVFMDDFSVFEPSFEECL
ncbi:uncharacterized protein LOC114318335 [Camellia sinensis]|uniref:uncharacterized protein LOC114318335 n=1 Tax=Camellia sinensis TaxID=4442 RepID=UPI0010355400|nr:uncharacterized protein LOC114318335 [Camellia sinensis]